MSWITRALKLRPFVSPAAGQREQAEPALSAVEQMEARLCLGTLNAPPLGDWPGVTAEQAPLPAMTSGTHFDQGSPLAGLSPNEPLNNTAGEAGRQQGTTSRSLPPASRAVSPPAERTAVSVEHGIDGRQLSNSLLGEPLTSSNAAGPGSGQQTGQFAEMPAGSENTDVPGVAGDGPSSGAAETSAPRNGAGRQQPEADSPSEGSINSDTLASLGFTLDAEGNATGVRQWWKFFSEPVTVKYDFRDLGEYDNEITQEQKERAVEALNAWTAATEGRVQFVRDTEAADSEILNLGTGDLAAFGGVSGADGTLGVGGGALSGDWKTPQLQGVAWLDKDENWDIKLGNGNPEGTYDFFTVVAHETGHALGFVDNYQTTSGDIMHGIYDVERSAAAVQFAAQNGTIRSSFLDGQGDGSYDVSPMITGFPQLVEADVEQLLDRASAASASNDAIIAVVDRGGNILGVRVEQGALNNIPDEQTLIFAIDGAVAKARTAAFFSNGDPANGTLAPLTSRLVQFISQSTVTQREVESNPNAELDPNTGLRTAAEVYASTEYGPGTVAPIGLGAHFPPGIDFTPPVDLFGIEHTNRDSLTHPGADGIKGTADDVVLPYRFNVDPGDVPLGQEIDAPESYGTVSGRMPNAQSRGIATLPGGVPIFRDTNNDGVGETLVGGIGVFFPGEDGFATHEQGFVQGAGQTTQDRLNAPRALEAEYIAFAAVGGSALAAQDGIDGAQIGELGGVARVDRVDLPFGRLDLVGINLPVLGPIAGRLGLERLLAFGRSLGEGNADSGDNQPLDLGADGMVDPNPDAPVDDVFFARGESVPEGYLVRPHDSPTGELTAADVRSIIDAGREAAELTRAAVRLPISSRTRMVFAVTDLHGEVLGVFRMKDATFFSIDVAVAKARNVAYYADPDELQSFDQIVDEGAAFTNRTFRFLAEPRFPDGIDGTASGPFSILNHEGIDPRTGENIGGPAAAGTFDPDISPDTASVLGYDSFFPNTNFQDPADIDNQNGIVFFPGSIPLYKNGRLVGGLGVSGDGVDQDDVVTFLASRGFEPPDNLRADQFFVRDVRLPAQKFLRNPFG